MEETEKRIYMRELSRLIDRSPHTIRGWERDGTLPVKLLPLRDEKDWRYWTDQQFNAIKKWMKQSNIEPGKGRLTEDRVTEMFAKLRQPREIKLHRCPHCRKKYKNLNAHIRIKHPSKWEKQIREEQKNG